MIRAHFVHLGLVHLLLPHVFYVLEAVLVLGRVEDLIESVCKYTVCNTFIS